MRGNVKENPRLSYYGMFRLKLNETRYTKLHFPLVTFKIICQITVFRHNNNQKHSSMVVVAAVLNIYNMQSSSEIFHPSVEMRKTKRETTTNKQNRLIQLNETKIMKIVKV